MNNLALTPEQKYNELYQKFATVSSSKTLYHNQVVCSIEILCDEMLANEPGIDLTILVELGNWGVDYSWKEYWEEVKSYTNCEKID